jgi:Transport protein Avl9
LIALSQSQGSFFGPYTPLQQLDLLASSETKSYLVGSTNSLLLQQKDKYSDILINLDDPIPSVTINSPSLRSALALSPADRRWIDFLTQTVNDTWDLENPGRPKNLGYAGSEEFIRLQFEEYLLALLSSTSYHIHQESSSTQYHSTITSMQEPPEHTDPTVDFSPDFLALWQTTPNYTLFASLTANARIYDIIEPRHPTAGGLSVEDIQRRFSQQVAELHLDERMREGREVLNKHFATGREKFGKLWAEVEARRSKGSSRGHSRVREESSTLDTTEAVNDTTTSSTSTPATAPVATTWTSLRERAAKIQLQKPTVDTAQMQASARHNATKAGAYLSSWGSWARERSREWQRGTENALPSGLRDGMNQDSKEGSADADAGQGHSTAG